MCHLQLTIAGFGLAERVVPLRECSTAPLPLQMQDLSLYCRYCGHDALALDSEGAAVCSVCYLAEANNCSVCGEVYTGDNCDNCETCCENCNEVISRDDVRTSDDGDDYCEECYCDLYCSCEQCSCEVSVDDLRCQDDTSYCEGCFDQHFTTCDDCNETARREECVDQGREREICQSCYEENYFTCDRCENVCHLDNYGEDGCCCDCSDDDGEDIQAIRFQPASNDCRRTGSFRRFGVELETCSCVDFCQLGGEVCFSSQDDGSIAAKEFVSEVLSGDAGLAEVEKFCRRSIELGFKVDQSCGYHLHIDVSDLNPDQLKNVSIAYNLSYELWASFVSDSRRKNRYCGQNGWDVAAISDCENFSDFARAQDRYQWFNVRAYCKHSTFEIRLHSGTLNSEKVCNWMIAHLRFVEAMAALSREEILRIFCASSPSSMFLTCCEFWPTEISHYLRQRADKFGLELPVLELVAV